MMDFFTKNKMLFWCVIVLIVLNAVTLTAFWTGKSHPTPFVRPGVQPDGQRIMQERLHLSNEQAAQIERLRNEHFMRTRPIQDDMHKIRMDLLDEIFAPEPDEAFIEHCLAELGEKQTAFERNLYRHFQELKEVCTPEQMQELKIMLRDLIERTRSRTPRSSLRGPDGEFETEHNGDLGPGRMPPEHMPPPRPQ